MAPPDAPAEDPPAVARLCAELIAYDSSVVGDRERPCAERVAELLTDLGLAPEVVEAEPGRTNVVARLAGTDPSLGALLVHIHLDVVPADPGPWQVPPYAGEIRDGHVWGRGAVDMKNMAAVTLTALAALTARGWRPRRDVVLAFVADEELGGGLGARHLVEHRPELFEGCTEAIGEAGGFSHEYAPGRRAYLVQVGEKGISWLRLVARGQGGHGSFAHDDNPTAAVAEAVTRIQAHEFGIRLCDSSRELVAAAQGWAGVDDPEQALRATGVLARFLTPTLRNTYTPTVLRAGVQANVVPAEAEAVLDGRYVPGYAEEFRRELADVVGDLVEIEVGLASDAVQTPFTGPVPDAVRGALAAVDPGCEVVPTCLPIGTDAKHFSRLGIACYGFSPLRLPPGYDFPRMFHGVDERVPVSALTFGQSVMEDFLERC